MATIEEKYWLVELDGLSFRFTKGGTSIITCALNDPLVDKMATEAEAIKWGETLERRAPWMKGRWKAVEHTTLPPAETPSAPQPSILDFAADPALGNPDAPGYFKSMDNLHCTEETYAKAPSAPQEGKSEPQKERNEYEGLKRFLDQQKVKPQDEPKRPDVTGFAARPFSYGQQAEAYIDFLEAEINRLKGLPLG